MKKEIYRIGITIHEKGYVEVEATNEKEALELAEEESNNGGFIGYNSYSEIEKILEKRPIIEK